MTISDDAINILLPEAKIVPQEEKCIVKEDDLPVREVSLTESIILFMRYVFRSIKKQKNCYVDALREEPKLVTAVTLLCISVFGMLSPFIIGPIALLFGASDFTYNMIFGIGIASGFALGVGVMVVMTVYELSKETKKYFQRVVENEVRTT